MSRKGELVGTLGIVAAGDLDRIAGVAQIDEVDALTTRPCATSRQGMIALGEPMENRRRLLALGACSAALKSSVPS
jgi:hypothetical protein